MTASEALSASLEDYLEAIYHIIARKQVARAKEIAKSLQVSNSSVTGALRALADRKLIHYEPYEIITLTPKGKTFAEDVIHRHNTLRDFFTKVLGVDDEEAEAGACKMEHSVPRTILDRLIQYIRFVEICPRGGIQWNEETGYYCEHEGAKIDCQRCEALSSDQED